MSAAQLTPFKSKAESRQAALSPKDAAGSAETPTPTTAGAPSKKACTAYEKTLQKMDGDTSLVKDSNYKPYQR